MEYNRHMSSPRLPEWTPGFTNVQSFAKISKWSFQKCSTVKENKLPENSVLRSEVVKPMSCRYTWKMGVGMDGGDYCRPSCVTAKYQTAVSTCKVTATLVSWTFDLDVKRRRCLEVQLSIGAWDETARPRAEFQKPIHFIRSFPKIPGLKSMIMFHGALFINLFMYLFLFIYLFIFHLYFIYTLMFPPQPKMYRINAPTPVESL